MLISLLSKRGILLDLFIVKSVTLSTMASTMDESIETLTAR